ncbi:MAG: valine--tRNA ligase [Firmicutes bacterium]|nr:valine--tRNA ligase [Bacillota bacterium]
MEKRYNFTQIEKRMQEFWEREKIYAFDKNAPGEIYSIDTPPPTVSGSLHIGHLFSYVQAEIIARFRRMQGYNVFYPFGFDDNGLPTERLVEREEGIRANALPRGEFIEKCRNTAEKYVNEFKDFWKTLGFSADWSLEYQTINPDVRKISQQLFLELVKSGKAYMKESPVLWCAECRTSIAQAELETADIESAYVYVPFVLAGNEAENAAHMKDHMSEDAKPNPATLIVATTRPELLYGCVCLFVNPSDGRYKDFIGKSVKVPLYDYEIPILADDKASIDKGTGVVMCATFGDSTDAEWYAEHELPYRKIILPDGTIAADVPYIAGLHVREARAATVRLLDERGLLLKSDNIVHTVGVHERCGKEVEIIPSRQWYIDVLTKRDEFLKAADGINWYPSQMKNRYIAWVENLKWDWCISRQRYFGVPFPVWYCEECGAPIFARPEQLPVNPLEIELCGTCDSCGSTSFVPESAVFDTWATSSVTPQINERLGLELTPMSMRTQAHEIIRTWAFYTIVRSLYHTGNIPWKDIMICGWVLAKKGEKIGKSKNNSESEPKALIETHSADVLRYWTAGARLGMDTFFSPDELSIPKRFITKLWNASKFAIAHLQDFDIADSDCADCIIADSDIADYDCADSPFTDKPELLPIDRWIIERVKVTADRAAKLLYEYEIGSARHEIDGLFWKDFCDNYIEIVKERLYEPEIHGVTERKSAQYALYYALLNILKLYSIYVPHISEYIYQEFFRRHEKTASIHKTLWVKPLPVERLAGEPSSANDRIILFGEKVKDVMAEVRRYKSERNLSMRAEMDELVIKTEPEFAEWFRLTEKDLKACTNAKEIIFTT